MAGALVLWAAYAHWRLAFKSDGVGPVLDRSRTNTQKRRAEDDIATSRGAFLPAQPASREVDQLIRRPIMCAGVAGGRQVGVYALRELLTKLDAPLVE